MRSVVAWLGGMFLILVGLANIVVRTEAFGQPADLSQVNSPPGSSTLCFPSSEVIALSSDVDAGHQQVVVIETKNRTMSVYHIKRETGEIALKSVRNFRWDMQLEEFNGTKPLPREIRALSDRPASIGRR